MKFFFFLRKYRFCLFVEAFNELFSRFKDDSDADYISTSRLTVVLQAFGRNPSQKDAEERIRDLENEGKTELTFGDFFEILNEQWTIANNDRDALRQALEKFDDNHEGFIEIGRFRTVLTTLGEPLSDEDLEVLIQLGADEEQTKISIDCTCVFFFSMMICSKRKLFSF